MNENPHIGAIRLLNDSIGKKCEEIVIREKRIIKLKKEIRDLKTGVETLSETIAELQKSQVI